MLGHSPIMLRYIYNLTIPLLSNNTKDNRILGIDPCTKIFISLWESFHHSQKWWCSLLGLNYLYMLYFKHLLSFLGSETLTCARDWLHDQPPIKTLTAESLMSFPNIITFPCSKPQSWISVDTESCESS
jgi:hypothetical protein